MQPLHKINLIVQNLVNPVTTLFGTYFANQGLGMSYDNQILKDIISAVKTTVENSRTAMTSMQTSNGVIRPRYNYENSGRI